jgi:hypothetical protein
VPPVESIESQDPSADPAVVTTDSDIEDSTAPARMSSAEAPDDIISFIVVARHNGMSCQRVAYLLNRLEVPPVRGRQWWASSVRRISERYGPLGPCPLLTRRAG